eukprot:TRINITY_DN31143_c0_g1_i1.p1 TRINITY_DN31143_c0_g1~~TRINITY_DN31143_c0_g1_i1.p1  ORF type:complete len:399 (+),score=68.03 TRINITY_DN31143_c0_g1_i1:94-1290(+)
MSLDTDLDNKVSEDAAALMDATDPELDPVWGLLFGAAEITEEASDGRHNGTMFDGNDEVIQAGRDLGSGIVSSESSVAHAACTMSQDDDSTTDGSVSVVPQSPRNKETERISNVVAKAEVSSSRFVLPPGDAPKPKRWDVDGCDAFVIDDVLSPEECNALVQQCDGLWSFWDDSEKPRVEFRNANTIEVTHRELAEVIWSRVSELVNPVVEMQEDDERFEIDIEGIWRPYAMNPTMLFAKYQNGGHFSPHTDGTTTVDFNRRTFYSCVLFLNKSPQGGETKLYADEQIRRELVKDSEGRLTGDPALVLHAVPPIPGRMVVFYHRLMHEGVPASEKYIIRTDVLYHREPELCTEPEDVEAFAMYEKAQLLAENGDVVGARHLFRNCFKLSPALRKIYKC